MPNHLEDKNLEEKNKLPWIFKFLIGVGLTLFLFIPLMGVFAGMGALLGIPLSLAFGPLAIPIGAGIGAFFGGALCVAIYKSVQTSNIQVQTFLKQAELEEITRNSTEEPPPVPTSSPEPRVVIQTIIHTRPSETSAPKDVALGSKNNDKAPQTNSKSISKLTNK